MTDDLYLIITLAAVCWGLAGIWIFLTLVAKAVAWIIIELTKGKNNGKKES